MTYEELKAQIADTLNRQDLTSVIPSFITMCEANLNRDLNHWRMEKRAATSFSDRYHTLPTDWIKTNRIQLDTGEPLTMISIDEMQSLRYSESNGKPKFYAHVAGEIELYPTPDESYDGQLYYQAQIPALSTGDNWVDDDVYLYGSLVHAAPYLQSDERLGLWVGLYNQAVMKLNSQSNSSKYSGTGLKMKLRGK